MLIFRKYHQIPFTHKNAEKNLGNLKKNIHFKLWLYKNFLKGVLINKWIAVITKTIALKNEYPNNFFSVSKIYFSCNLWHIFTVQNPSTNPLPLHTFQGVN